MPNLSSGIRFFQPTIVKGGDILAQTNVNSTDLIQALRNIQTGSRSVETTRSLIKTKYQQIGADWNDKKYKELGDVLQDCYRALNELQKILLQAEKYLALLAKQIQEYESVNLGGANSRRNSFIQGLRVDGSDHGTQYQYCLGVLTQGSFPDGYGEILSARHENAEPAVKKVFDHYSGMLMIRDTNYPANETAHYAPNGQENHQRGVYYNATADMSNPRGAGSTYFHELGHMIDHASTEYQGNLSNNPEFGNALIEDGQRILSLFNNLPHERQEAFLQRINQDSAHSFSDLIDATTSGQLHGSYGHSRSYWTRPGNLQAEAFAHFFEASMGDYEKMSFLANFFPTAFGIFSSMIDSIQPTGYSRARVLER